MNGADVLGLMNIEGAGVVGSICCKSGTWAGELYYKGEALFFAYAEILAQELYCVGNDSIRITVSALLRGIGPSLAVFGFDGYTKVTFIPEVS